MTDFDSLPPMHVMSRAGRLRERLDTCDALLVTKMVHIRYLTGFTGSAGMLLVLPDELLLVTDGRYGEQAVDQLAAAGVDAMVRVVLTVPGQYEVLGTAATSLRLGVEANAVTWAAARA